MIFRQAANETGVGIIAGNHKLQFEKNIPRAVCSTETRRTQLMITHFEQILEGSFPQAGGGLPKGEGRSFSSVFQSGYLTHGRRFKQN